MKEPSCGSVSIIGLPNAGKSTLVNALVGSKVSIVSAKVQTTRTRVLGITLHGAAQVILIDTPGVFAPKKTMEKAMVGTAFNALSEGDIALHLVDVTDRRPLENNQIIVQKLPRNVPVVLVLNKIDQIAKDKLLGLSAELNAGFDYAETYMISALKKSGLDRLMAGLAAHMPAGAWHYDEDEITTTPMRLLAAEITREKIFNQLYQELPYAVLVETEAWEDFDNGDVKISQIVTVETNSQKGIILGKQGAQVKKIGQASREELEEIMGRKVHLKLFVRVQPGWQEKTESYRIMGMEV
jgi:GTP-binding protein Era